jgi:hypothetical protein
MRGEGMRSPMQLGSEDKQGQFQVKFRCCVEFKGHILTV